MINEMNKFDYRVLHRGTANKTDVPRPILVITFGKNWYKVILYYTWIFHTTFIPLLADFDCILMSQDTLNFPKNSVFSPPDLS